MANVLDRIPWTIANAANVSQVLEIDANAIIVGLVVSSAAWTAAKLALLAYIPDSGKGEPGGLDQVTGSWQGGPYDAGATFTALLDDTGLAMAWGDGTSVIAQYIQLGVAKQASAAPISTLPAITGVRYIKVQSGTVAGAVITGVNQGAARTGYVILRRLT